LGGTGKLSGLPVAGPRATPSEDAAASFARHVSQRLHGPILTYSQRQALVTCAQRQGITRFEANLIMAAVLHRSGIEQELAPPEPARTIRRWAIPAITFAFVQGSILAGAWWLLR
jgi:hypothetical protein